MTYVRRRFLESFLHLFNFFPAVTATSKASYEEAVRSDIEKCRLDLEKSMVWYSTQGLSEDKEALEEVSKRNGRS